MKEKENKIEVLDEKSKNKKDKAIRLSFLVIFGPKPVKIGL